MSTTDDARPLTGEIQTAPPRPGISRTISILELIEMEERVAAQTLSDVLASLSRTEPNDNDLVSACFRVGRDSAPTLIHILWRDENWRPMIVGVVGSVWSLAEYPENLMPRDEWIEMFRAAGFRDDGEISEPPADAVTVYRGATQAGRLGMCWTTDLETARTFAHGGLRGRPAGSVWKARVSPEFVLARIGGPDTRGESEVVVDPGGLSEVLELEPCASQRAEDRDGTNGECIMCPQPAVVTTAAVDLRYGIDYTPLCADCLGEPWD